MPPIGAYGPQHEEIDLQIKIYRSIRRKGSHSPAKLESLKQLEQALIRVNKAYRGEDECHEQVNSARAKHADLNTNGKRMELDVAFRPGGTKKLALSSQPPSYPQNHLRDQMARSNFAMPRPIPVPVPHSAPIPIPTIAGTAAPTRLASYCDVGTQVNFTKSSKVKPKVTTSSLAPIVSQSSLHRIIHVCSRPKRGRDQRVYEDEEEMQIITLSCYFDEKLMAHSMKKMVYYRNVKIKNFWSDESNNNPETIKMPYAHCMLISRKLKAFVLGKSSGFLEDEHNELIGQATSSHGNISVTADWVNLIIVCANQKDKLAILIGQSDQQDVWATLKIWSTADSSYKPDTKKELVLLMMIRLFLGCRRNAFENLLSCVPDRTIEDVIWDEKLREVKSIGYSLFHFVRGIETYN